MDFRETTVIDLVKQVNAKEMSARDLTEAALDNIQRLDGDINSFCAVNSEQALKDADEVDASVARGDNLPLAGIPIGVKDLEDARGFVTSFGSALHADDPVAEADSELVSRMKKAGCVVLGKTNTPEFGHKGKTDNVPFGITRNPWNLAYTPGGSSGGSAAALAAGIIPLATGSDGGGSIRIPSAICGLSGIKTSQGRIPNGGLNPPGSGLLTVKGPMTSRILDTAHVLDQTVGDFKTDIFGQLNKEESWLAGVQSSSLPETVIWSPTMGFATVDEEIKSLCETAVSKLEAAGVTVIVNDAIWQEDPVQQWLVFWTCARARAQQHLMGTDDWEKIDPQLRTMIEIGASRMSGPAYASAIDACHHLNYQLETAFEAAPLILTPATCGHTPEIDKDGVVNGEETPGWVAFTMGLNMTRNPAGVVPVDKTGAGLPIALQVIGRQREDLSVLRAVHALEGVFGFGEKADVS
ncbi:MAG TPA: amidase [Pseudomonadales bacterium]|jgi:Asp-tRNA(Asn)/Glu-tRNA(Gln) amidotransferase A subunit family amidase|nr:amidase [Pseudomonadales bacterium]MDP7315680.1 amidase [Pseudomonadales bacterium]MDP7452302.1 amidase [Arenicellales bacterium]HJL61325.1 amidase [Pseudomonadales bacterium]HJP49956.1 amidase [Pseudomonadales bacterium]|tara:strand:- start:3108 stop:4508 length:1401 start_codon:yes stop_codon:yes gene_type:complete